MKMCRYWVFVHPLYENGGLGMRSFIGARTSVFLAMELAYLHAATVTVLAQPNEKPETLRVLEPMSVQIFDSRDGSIRREYVLRNVHDESTGKTEARITELRQDDECHKIL